MQTISRNQYRWLLSAWLVIALVSSSALARQAGTAATKSAVTLTAAERETAARVKLETIRDVTTTLVSKEFEGRGTGQPGADKAARYLADRFVKLGLKPLGENGSYLQPIKFKIAQVLPESTVKLGDVMLKHGEDYVVLPPYTSEQVDVTGGLVFAAYGAVSAELKRDDLAGLELKDKVVIVLGGQPQGVDTAAWKRATSPQARALNIFGRGAAAMIFVDVGTQAQPFSTIANYLSRRRVNLGSTTEPLVKKPPVVLASNVAIERVFAGSAMTFSQTLQKAMSGEMVSRDLGKPARIALRIKREEAMSSNVLGLLEGSDEKLKQEAVVYTAHYDAYGIEPSGRMYPGAADNALGTATITAIAEAFAKSKLRPRRSVIFLAVTGEEYGLLGAEYWVQHPTWPLEKLAADINFDGIGTEVYGPVRRIVGFGAEHSDLGTILEDVSAATGNTVTPDPLPEEDAFVRSDHYAFVKKGVPALMLLGGPEGEVSQWIPRAKKWLETDYHSPGDTVKPDWNWTGPQTLAQVGLVMGMRVANAESMPAWRPSSPFNQTRTRVK